MSRRTFRDLDPESEPQTASRPVPTDQAVISHRDDHGYVEAGSQPYARSDAPRSGEFTRDHPSSGSWPNAWASSEDTMRASRWLEAPPPERVPELLLRLSRDVDIDMRDEQIVCAFVDSMSDLFQARRFAVRLFAKDGQGLELIHGSIPLRGDATSHVSLERRAAERHALRESDLARLGVVLTDSYHPLFEEGAHGFDVPLTDGARILGIVSVEYPTGFEVPAWDAPIVVPLGLELAAKLRGARLLRESNYLRDYLSQVIERANAPIVVLRTDRRIENVNLAMMTAIGGQRERWLGRDFLEFLPPSDHARALLALEAAIAGEAMSNVELRLPRKNGGFARIAFNTASISASGGPEVAGVVAIGRDLTEVRDLEEQIIHAEKLATLGQLAAGVVHELNNPLTSIAVYSEYLLTKGQRSGADAADLDKLGRIAEAAERMLRFTRDLVTYARPSSEEPTLLRLGEVIDQALMFCDHVISDANVVVERHYPDELPSLWAVRGQLHQVFINLVTNACHAMAARKVEDTRGRLVVRVDEDGDGTAVVVVADDGPGIAPEHVEHIFEPFFSTKGEGRGTGLGLSIVRNIIQQHGGSIEVSSRHGESPAGTEFRLRFPPRRFTGG